MGLCSILLMDIRNSKGREISQKVQLLLKLARKSQVSMTIKFHHHLFNRLQLYQAQEDHLIVINNHLLQNLIQPTIIQLLVTKINLKILTLFLIGIQLYKAQINLKIHTTLSRTLKKQNLHRKLMD